jgi:predicted transcriptional regulator
VPSVPSLRKVRESKFLTQAHLSLQSGVTQATISRLENGQHEATFSTIRKLAGALGVAPGELVEPQR